MSARFAFWQATVFAVGRMRPLSGLSEADLVRLGYAMLQSASRPRTRATLQRVLAANLHRDAAIDLQLAEMVQQQGDLARAVEVCAATAKHYAATEYAAVASAKQRLSAGLLDGSVRRQIDDSLKSLPLQGGALWIVTAVSSNYLPMFELWLEQTSRHAQARLLILTLDTTVAKRLRGTNLLTLDLSDYFAVRGEEGIHKGVRRSLWILRLLVVRAMVEQGLEVLALDLDAMLVGDLQSLLQQLPGADAVVQEDYSIPMEVARRRGFILCCGVMLFRPSAAVNAFLERFAKQTEREMDDQLALNHLLAGEQLQQMRYVDGHRCFTAAGLRWVCPDRKAVSRDLHTGTVIRHFEQKLTKKDVAELRIGLGL